MYDTLKDIINGVAIQPPVERYSSLAAMGSAVVNLFIGIAFGFGILSIAYSAVSYVLSQGNPDKTKTAWNAFIYGVIASAVALLLISLKFIALRLFGIQDTNLLNTPNF